MVRSAANAANALQGLAAILLHASSATTIKSATVARQRPGTGANVGNLCVNRCAKAARSLVLFTESNGDDGYTRNPLGEHAIPRKLPCAWDRYWPDVSV